MRSCRIRFLQIALLTAFILTPQVSQAQNDTIIKETPAIIAPTREPQPVGIKLIDFNKWPGVKQGMAYDAKESAINSLTTIDIAKYKAFSFEVGAAGDSEPNDWKAVIVLSIDLLHVGDWIQFPILNKIVFRPGIWYGSDLNFKQPGETENSWGFSITALEVKF